MIRHFQALYKTLLNKLTDEAIFQEATEGFIHHEERCPNCGAAGKLTPYGDYSRHLVSYEGGRVVDRLILPLRFACGSCEATHALLPEILIPYSPYSLRFKLLVLIAYFERETTVAAICERFHIAISTLYAWKSLLLEHKELMLGALASRREPAPAFLREIFASRALQTRLRHFFRRYAFSFLQNQSVSAARSHPP